MDWIFVSGSKWRTHVLLAVTFWDRMVSPLASKRANPEEITFILVLCSSVRLWGTHVLHTFQDQRSRMMWLLLPLLIERLHANCQVVMRQSTRTMASAPCSISRLAAQRERPERGWSWSFAFPISEAVILFTQWPMVLLSTASPPQTLQRRL